MVVGVGAFIAFPVVPPLTAFWWNEALATVPVHMPFTNESAIVSRLLQDFRHAQLFGRQIRIIQKHACGSGETTSHQCGTMRRAHRTDRHGVAIVEPFLRQPVKVRRLHVGVTRIAHGIPTPFIGHQVKDVGPLVCG